MRGDTLTFADEDLDHIGEIQLTLHVLRLELLDRRPEGLAPKHVDRRVDLADLLFRRGRVRPFGDPQHRAVGVANDAPVQPRIRRLGTEDRRGGGLARCVATRSTSSCDVRSGVSPESTSTSPECDSSAECAVRTASPVPSGGSCTTTVTSLSANSSRPVGDATTTSGCGACLASGLEHPVDHATAEDRMEMLRNGGAHAGAEPSGHDDSCDGRVVGHRDIRAVRFRMAGAPGFEPGIAGPKPAALPLGYAPQCGEYKPGLLAFSEEEERAPRSRRPRSAPIATAFRIPSAIGTQSTSSCEAAKIQLSCRIRSERLLRPTNHQSPTPIAARPTAAHQWRMPARYRSPSTSAIQSVIRTRRSRSQRPRGVDPCSITVVPYISRNGTTVLPRQPGSDQRAARPV